MADNVNHPGHYTFGRIEVIDYIEDVLGKEGCASYCLGNTLKYLSRANYKYNKLEDIQKAKWYLDRCVETLQGLEHEIEEWPEFPAQDTFVDTFEDDELFGDLVPSAEDANPLFDKTATNSEVEVKTEENVTVDSEKKQGE